MSKTLVMPIWWQVGNEFLYPEDKNRCIVLPYGRWRDVTTVGVRIGERVLGVTYDIDCRLEEHLFLYLYRNEWHMSSIENQENPQEFLKGCVLSVEITHLERRD